jgi:hypothetical protein
MNDYSFISECFDFSFSLTEKQNWTLRNLAGPLEIRSQFFPPKMFSNNKLL